MGTKKAYLRRLLLDRSNWIEQRLIDHAEINGYGDVTPMSGYGKLIGALTALSGVFTVALLTGIVASAFSTRVRRQEIEFTTEVEELIKDGHMSAKEQRTIEHLRQEFSITEDHARAIIRQILEEQSLYEKKSR